MRCQYCNEVLFKDDLPKKKHENNCGLNPKYKTKKCTCLPIRRKWEKENNNIICSNCGGEL